jgi:hypothetical protein
MSGLEVTIRRCRTTEHGGLFDIRWEPLCLAIAARRPVNP